MGHYPNDDLLFKDILVDNASLLFEIPLYFIGFFRGQREDWELKTRLIRAHEERREYSEIYKNRNSSILEIEKRIFEEYKRRVNIYNSINLKEDIEYLSHLQHYGGPTRLLDFTNNFLVSIYFAVYEYKKKESETQANVWYVNKDRYYKAINCKSSFLEQCRIDYIDFKIGSQYSETIEFVEPNRFNARINNQQGLFAIQKNINTNFEVCLFKTFNKQYEATTSENIIKLNVNNISKIGFDTSIVKIRIDEKIEEEVRLKLQYYNILSDIIYPDINGLALRMNDYFLR